MRKMFSILVALVMALSCTLALAEESSSFTLPQMTIVSETTVDAEVLKEVLPMMGIGADQTAMVDAIVALVNASGEKLIIADNGIQFDMTLKGEPVLSLGGALTDEGISIASTLIPSHVIKITKEELQQLLEQLTGSFQINQGEGTAENAMAGLDLQALAEKLTGYMTEITTAASGAVTTGTPESGEFTVNGHSFNMRVPMSVDLKVIAEAATQAAKKALEDETVLSALESLKSFGMNIDLDELKKNLEAGIPEEDIPGLDAFTYVNVNEKGETDGVNCIEAQLTAHGAEDPTAYIVFYQEDSDIMLSMDIPDSKTEIVIHVVVGEDGNVTARVDVTSAGMYVGVQTITAQNRETIELYMFNAEKPLLTEVITVEEGGERTLDLEAGEKTVVSLADLTSGNTASLLEDLTQKGVASLMSGIFAQVPEAGSLIMQLMGGMTQTQTTPAE